MSSLRRSGPAHCRQGDACPSGINFRCEALTTGLFHLISHSAQGPHLGISVPLLTLAPCPQHPPLISRCTRLPATPGSLRVPAGVISAVVIRKLEEGEPYMGVCACELLEPRVSGLTLRDGRDGRWVQHPFHRRRSQGPTEERVCPSAHSSLAWDGCLQVHGGLLLSPPGTEAPLPKAWVCS